MNDGTAHPIIHHEEIASTHRFAIENGKSLASGTVIMADHQSSGRGRRGREWLSPAGESLLISIVLKPNISASDAALITPILSLAVAELLQQQSISPMIRWPNDIEVSGRKIAGILAEATLSGDTPELVVASLGLNVLQDEGTLSGIDRPATSIKLESGTSKNPAKLLPPLLERFDAYVEELISEGFRNLAKRWRSLLMPMGSLVSLDLGGNIIQGSVSGFGDDGSIEIEEDGGAKTSFHSGEIVRLQTLE
jgi:BirA family transcriptional regulator, biotin operon repressor / biotin---[acetyl-CoA-carboxylase] ligase